MRHALYCVRCAALMGTASAPTTELLKSVLPAYMAGVAAMLPPNVTASILAVVTFHCVPCSEEMKDADPKESGDQTRISFPDEPESGNR